MAMSFIVDNKYNNRLPLGKLVKNYDNHIVISLKMKS